MPRPAPCRGDSGPPLSRREPANHRPQGYASRVTKTRNGRNAGPLLVLGAVGVVFGDIGTSTLYAMSAVLKADASGGSTVSTSLVYGMVSTIIWSMILIVTLLYAQLLLRTDNDGEGGLLALVGLLRQTLTPGRLVGALSLLGVFGAALFLGDSVITPAISVLSAAEGLKLVSPSLSTAVVPFAVVVLAGLFVIQRFGTGRIGSLFGPVMVLWFASTAVWGAVAVAKEPAVLQALSPHWVFLYFRDEPRIAFLSLGAIVLAVTGAEALYADLGHFGRRAIVRAWLFIVFPALVLNYLGQAAAVVHSSAAVGNPFFAVVPTWARLPMVAMATLATIIASQAVISGAFTVIHQASRLGYLPPIKITHTSSQHVRQIYIGAGNWLLAAAVLAVVLAFRSSASLASAYGVAVTSTITITTIVYIALRWRRDRRASGGLMIGVIILAVELVFLAANVPKVKSGGWLPLSIGIILMVVMTTWRSGRRRVDAARSRDEGTVEELVSFVRQEGSEVSRVPGSAVFLVSDASIVPIAMRAAVDLNHTLHAHVVLLSWRTVDSPLATPEERIKVDVLGDPTDGIVQVRAVFGFREHPDVLKVLDEAAPLAEGELDHLDTVQTIYFVSAPVLRVSRESAMPRWRQRLFLTINRMAPDPVELLRLPPARTVVISQDVRW